MTPEFRGPYSIGQVNDKPMRHNDGSMIIMGRDQEGEDTVVLLVPMRARPKRGEAWRTSDPDQEAFARAVVDALNAIIKAEV